MAMDIGKAMIVLDRFYGLLDKHPIEKIEKHAKTGPQLNEMRTVIEAADGAYPRIMCAGLQGKKEIRRIADLLNKPGADGRRRVYFAELGETIVWLAEQVGFPRGKLNYSKKLVRELLEKLPPTASGEELMGETFAEMFKNAETSNGAGSRVRMLESWSREHDRKEPGVGGTSGPAKPGRDELDDIELD